ncbi:MAG TPA: multicopper oxidase domain-containing protein [Longimicrobium sp.]|nr:multicopper oxidase domain-containing protein [Longimicrobium sp.]
MRFPVVLALAVPLVIIGGGLGAYSLSRPVASQTRTFYIAADEVAYPAPAAASAGTGGGPAEYRTAVYREYTDSTFTTVKERPAQWKHLAFLGPLIRAGVGDTIRVVFRNRVSFPANVHPDGVLQHHDAPAAATLGPNTLGADLDDTPVPPGGSRVYTWSVPSAAGPGPEDLGSVLWLYHSRTGAANGVEAALIGPMIVYKRGALAGEPRPR